LAILSSPAIVSIGWMMTASVPPDEAERSGAFPESRKGLSQKAKRMPASMKLAG
jgi:hypothetical protein